MVKFYTKDKDGVLDSGMKALARQVLATLKADATTPEFQLDEEVEIRLYSRKGELEDTLTLPAQTTISLFVKTTSMHATKRTPRDATRAIIPRIEIDEVRYQLLFDFKEMSVRRVELREHAGVPDHYVLTPNRSKFH